MNRIIEFFAGAFTAAVLLWVLCSCFEIGFNNFASDLNAIKIFLEVTQ